MEALFLAFSLMPFAIAMLLGIALPAALVGAYGSFGFGLVVAACAGFIDNATFSQPLLRVGLTVYPADVPLVLLGAAAALRFATRRTAVPIGAAWWVLIGLFFAKLALGLVIHGTAAGVQARPQFFALAAAAYVMSFPIDGQRIRQLLNVLVLLAVATLLLAVYRWTVFYLPIRELLPPGGIYNPDGEARVIYSNYALILAEILVIGLFFGGLGGSSAFARVLSPVLLGATLFLQHRSVWLATIVGVLGSLLLARSQRAPLWQQVALLLMVAVTVGGSLQFSDTASQQVESSAARAVAGEGTVDARIKNWRSSIQKWAGEGPRAIVMGSELGADPTRTVEGEHGTTMRIKFFAHNQYVTVLTEYGVVGLLATIWIYGVVVVGLWRLCQRMDDSSALSAALLVLMLMQLSYYVAYGIDFAQYLITGVAYAWVAAHRKPAEQKLDHRRSIALARRTLGVR